MKKSIGLTVIVVVCASVLILAAVAYLDFSAQVLGYAQYDGSAVQDNVAAPDTPSCTDTNKGIFSKLPGEATYKRWHGSFTLKNRCNPKVGIMTDFSCQGKFVVATKIPCPVCNAERSACEGAHFKVSVTDPPSEELRGSGSWSGSGSLRLTLDSALEEAQPGDRLSLQRPSFKDRQFLLFQKTPERCALYALESPLTNILADAPDPDDSQDSLLIFPKDNERCLYETTGIFPKNDPLSLWEFFDQRVAQGHHQYEKYCTKKIDSVKIRIGICDVPTIGPSDLDLIFNRDKFGSQRSGLGGGLRVTISF